MNKNFTTSIVVDKSPEEVFAAINNVRGWWSGKFEGDTDKLGSEFVYKYGDMHHSVQKITELVPGKKIVWDVIESNLSFLSKKNEWDDTKIVFDIVKKDNKTEVTFTHIGLVPSIECYGACSGAWDMLVNGNLKKYIETGKPQPDIFA